MRTKNTVLSAYNLLRAALADDSKSEIAVAVGKAMRALEGLPFVADRKRINDDEADKEDCDDDA